MGGGGFLAFTLYINPTQIQTGARLILSPMFLEVIQLWFDCEEDIAAERITAVIRLCLGAREMITTGVKQRSLQCPAETLRK